MTNPDATLALFDGLQQHALFPEQDDRLGLTLEVCKDVASIDWLAYSEMLMNSGWPQ
jgi:hypothetical protein